MTTLKSTRTSRVLSDRELREMSRQASKEVRPMSGTGIRAVRKFVRVMPGGGVVIEAHND